MNSELEFDINRDNDKELASIAPINSESETHRDSAIGEKPSSSEVIDGQAALPHDLNIFRSLRKIIRAVDIYSRRLKLTYGLTVPQLICLSAIAQNQRLTSIELAGLVHIAPSTLVGILDRLEKMKLIRRERNSTDRREILISPTLEGIRTASGAPSLLQENLANGLKLLSSAEQAQIALSLKKIVEMMKVEDIEAAPLLTIERRSYAGRMKKTNKT